MKNTNSDKTTTSSSSSSLQVFDVSFGETITRLLARENLVVEFDLVDTAYFFPKERKVVLPSQYVALNRNLLSLLSAHEVSHALHTPDRFFEDVKVYSFPVLMILEDARIENLIKEEFPGLVYTFKSAYETLLEQDFFGIQHLTQEEINVDLSFLDRINLKAKGGELIDVFFDKKEQDFFDRVMKVREYEDLLFLAQEYLDRFSEKEDESETIKLFSAPSDKREDDKGERIKSYAPPGKDGEKGGKEEKEGTDEPDDDNNGSSGSASSSSSPDYNDTPNNIKKEGSTLDAEDAFRKNLKSPIADSSITQMPDAKSVQRYVVPYKKVIASRHNATKGRLSPSKKTKHKKIIDNVHKQAKIMAMEFEQKKSAYRNSRSKISDTGIIDTARLAHYKTTDEIFKKIKKTPDGKNHGMIIFVDYSGSMASLMPSVIQQLLIFTEFCRRVKIPFEVYAFSNRMFSEFSKEYQEQSLFEEKPSEDFVGRFKGKTSKDLVGLNYRAQINLFSSRMKEEEYKKAFEQMSLMSADYGHLRGDYDSLAGTPLQETVIDSFGLTEKFLKENPKLQKVNTIYLTDGDGSDVSIGKNVRVGNKIYTTGGREYVEHFSPFPPFVPNNRKKRSKYILIQEFLKEIYEAHYGIKMSNIFMVSNKDLSSRYNRFRFNEESMKSLDRFGFIEVDSDDDKKNGSSIGIGYGSKNYFSSKSVEWSKFFIVSVSPPNESTAIKAKGSSLDDLTESFTEGSINAAKHNNISRKLAGFVS